jgi:hypothetical protein
MQPQFKVASATGTLSIGDTCLEPFQPKAEVELRVGTLIQGEQDHENGYFWLYLGNLTFGGHPAALGLCFHEGLLEQVSWSVCFPDAAMEGGWPTREAIDEEIAFVRRTLERDGFRLENGVQDLAWGKVFACFDPKGFLAANGLRFRSA